MLPACMSALPTGLAGRPCNRMCVSVQNQRLAMRMMTSTKEASGVGVSVGERAGPRAGWRDVVHLSS